MANWSSESYNVTNGIRVLILTVNQVGPNLTWSIDVVYEQGGYNAPDDEDSIPVYDVSFNINGKQILSGDLRLDCSYRVDEYGHSEFTRSGTEYIGKDIDGVNIQFTGYLASISSSGYDTRGVLNVNENISYYFDYPSTPSISINDNKNNTVTITGTIGSSGGSQNPSTGVQVTYTINGESPQSITINGSSGQSFIVGTFTKTNNNSVSVSAHTIGSYSTYSEEITETVSNVYYTPTGKPTVTIKELTNDLTNAIQLTVNAGAAGTNNPVKGINVNYTYGSVKKSSTLSTIYIKRSDIESEVGTDGKVIIKVEAQTLGQNSNFNSDSSTTQENISYYTKPGVPTVTINDNNDNTVTVNITGGIDGKNNPATRCWYHYELYNTNGQVIIGGIDTCPLQSNLLLNILDSGTLTIFVETQGSCDNVNKEVRDSAQVKTSSSVKFYTKPTSPDSLQIIDNGDSTFSLTWGEGTDGNNNPIDDYIAIYATRPVGSNEELMFTPVEKNFPIAINQTSEVYARIDAIGTVPTGWNKAEDEWPFYYGGVSEAQNNGVTVIYQIVAPTQPKCKVDRDNLTYSFNINNLTDVVGYSIDYCISDTLSTIGKTWTNLINKDITTDDLIGAHTIEEIISDADLENCHFSDIVSQRKYTFIRIKLIHKYNTEEKSYDSNYIIVSSNLYRPYIGHTIDNGVVTDYIARYYKDGQWRQCRVKGTSFRLLLDKDKQPIVDSNSEPIYIY